MIVWGKRAPQKEKKNDYGGVFGNVKKLKELQNLWQEKCIQYTGRRNEGTSSLQE